MSLLTLPDELLSFVVEYLADTIAEPTSLCHFKPVSTHIIRLSLVNSRYRRICLPFLFTRVKFTARKIKKFKRFCSKKPICSSLIKSIHPHMLSSRRDEEDLLCQTLPYLTRLSCMDMTDMCPSFDFLHTIINYPTVATVRLASLSRLPPGSLLLDMSKVVISHVSLTQNNGRSEFDKHLCRGLTVLKAELYKFHYLAEISRLDNFAGLKEIALIGVNPASCQELFDLTTTHPNLRQLWLTNEAWNANLTPSIIHPFRSEALKQDLDGHFRITSIGFNRHPGQDWYASSLTLVATFASDSPTQILALVASYFPAIELLSLDLEEAQKSSYTMEDLVTVLRCFHALRTLHLSHVFRRLHSLESQQWSQPLRSLTEGTPIEKLAFEAEARVVWYVSHLAKELASLDAFHIVEQGYLWKNVAAGPMWIFQGWLYVINSNREIDGKLYIRYRVPDNYA